MNSSSALTHAWEIQQDASSVGFDWPTIDGPFAKVREELDELAHAWKEQDARALEEELGDLLFHGCPGVSGAAVPAGPAPMIITSNMPLCNRSESQVQWFLSACQSDMSAGKLSIRVFNFRHSGINASMS